nr:serine hydrolase [uncultured Agathobacter sp.]
MSKFDLDVLHQTISDTQSNICQAVIVKEGKLIYADTWNGYSINDAVHIASATKSVVALLVGIAIDKGYIDSLEQHILDFFPEYTLKRGEKTLPYVKLKHLLSMTVPYKFKSEPWTRICGSDDWVKTTLDIEKCKCYIADNRENHISFITSRESQGRRWLCDTKENAAAGFGLCLSAMDMAKIGQLCVNNGKYNGKSIVSESWITQMLMSHSFTEINSQKMKYGYLWWIIDAENKIYAAIGDSGNVIYIDVKDEIVVAIASSFKPSVHDRITFIQHNILPYLW